MKRFHSLVIAAALGAAGAAQAAIPAAQRQYLIDLYNHTNGPAWTFRTNWLGPVGSECTWIGVTCNDPSNADPANFIRYLSLASNNLTDPVGAALPDWSALTGIRGINLSSNNLAGTVPPIAPLAQLRTFTIDHNDLQGVPPDPSGLVHLTTYAIASNQFTGPLPVLANLPALEMFHANHNHLTGGIASLAGTPALRQWLVNDNQLSGPIPTLPGTLEIIQAQNNHFSGPIPAAPGALVAGSSMLCPNHITPSINAAWDKASTVTPWYTGCGPLPPGPGPGAGNPAPIPTLGEWALILLSTAAAALGFAALRRRKI